MHFLFFILLTLTSTVHALDAKVLLVKGHVTVNNKQVIKDQVIIEGSEINAQGPKNLVQLSFSDGSRMMLKDGVILVDKPKEDKGSLIRLLRGVLYAEKAKGESSLKVITKNAVLGVRGTKFFVMENPDDTYMCVCEGVVAVSNKVTTTNVAFKEDATVKEGVKFEKNKANPVMWKIAQDGFKEMQ